MDKKKLEEFSNKKIMVVGDVMLDSYLYGESSRISPEAPVPVVRVTREEHVPGGAGNTAMNLRSLGAQVYLAGICGKDSAGKLLNNILNEEDIHSLLIEDPSRPTIVKKRVVAGNHYQMLRLDYEEHHALDQDVEKKMFENIQKNINKMDALVFSDYAKGHLSEKLVRSIIKLADIPIIVDTKPAHVTYFKGCSLITPNLKEAIEMTEISEDIGKMGSKLVDMLNCNAFITRGAEGISVFTREGKHQHIAPVRSAKVFDVTGAGDTVAAVAALGLSSQMDLIETARLANIAGGLVVQKPGTATVTVNELKSGSRHEISHFLTESIQVKQRVIENQVHKIEEAAEMVIDAYRKGHKVVAFGNGGSASDAQHLVGELVGRFRIERKGLPAVALTTDSSVVTAIANDYGYDEVFARQVEANAQKGDVVVGISTSGNSPNVIRAMKKAKSIGCKTIGLTGKEGGELAKICDVSIVVPSDNTPRIQEAHIAIIHILCELLEKDMENA